MENKDLIIIALVILVIYLYYQQNNLIIQPVTNNPEISELRNQVNHYQTLYQKRVEKDLENQEYLGMLNQKITDLENSLLNLAKHKIKGKKDAEKLIEQLETNYQQKEQEWKEEKFTIFQNYNQTKEQWQQEVQEQLRKINLLFDEKAQDYEVIDFDGLYKLLASIAERERERERERAK